MDYDRAGVNGWARLILLSVFLIICTLIIANLLFG